MMQEVLHYQFFEIVLFKTNLCLLDYFVVFLVISRLKRPFSALFIVITYLWCRDNFLVFVAGMFLVKFTHAFDLRSVTGRKLQDFPYFDRRTLRKCIQLSHIAYRDSEKLEC